MKTGARREAAIAAWQAVDEYYKAHADDNGDLSAEDTQQLERLNAAAKDADKAWADAADAEGMAIGARERAETIARAVTGKGIDWSRVGTVAPQPGVQGNRIVSAGEQFVQSDEYKALLASGALKSDRARIGTSAAFTAAATDVVHTGSAGGALDLVRPTFLPDIIPLDQRPRTVRSLFSNDTAPDAPIRDARQTAFDNAAAAVAQATSAAGATNAATGLKPQSSVAWEEFEVSPKTIATWMATTRQAVGQVNRLRSLIDDNGRVMIELAEEDQILNGDGNGPNISGLLDQDGLLDLDASTLDADTGNLDALRVAKRLIRTGPARVGADAVLLHPEDSEQYDLMKDGENRYRAGDPFASGGPELAPIWRLTRVESEAVEPGTAIVGAFKLGGTVYQVQPLTIYVSDSHEDYFVKNLLAILFEERIALVIRRPSAFCVVTLAEWPNPVGS